MEVEHPDEEEARERHHVCGEDELVRQADSHCGWVGQFSKEGPVRRLWQF